uniref:Small ribosomal subunit protein uS8c n=1 Tax=Scoliosorus ensiformis TaxID=38541 RepID=A0A3G5CUJ9_9MONI|nr:ribosomal protein S8 [Scoliosorus ensiformis]AYW16542.1 ribosomal protein S8 [Scoliosorus ensiformis]
MKNDTIFITVTSIRNANIKRKALTRIPGTRITRSIVKILLEEGFLKSVTEHAKDGNIFLDLRLKYFGKGKEPCITTLKYISKPGLRIYSHWNAIPKILGGMGIAISSTSRGLITDRKARQMKIGGEMPFQIW